MQQQTKFILMNLNMCSIVQIHHTTSQQIINAQQYKLEEHSKSANLCQGYVNFCCHVYQMASPSKSIYLH